MINIIDFYVDESCITLNGRPVLVYGTVTPVRLEEALDAVVTLRRNHRLPPDGEIK